MDTNLHRGVVICVLGVVLAMVLAAALLFATVAPAWAQPITVTTHDRTKGGTFTYTDTFHCQNDNELYTITASHGHELVHITASGIDENGEYIPPFHFHYSGAGQVVAVPADGTGPTYKGRYREREQLNAMQFDDFIGTYSYSDMGVARGSDGSKVNFHVLVRYSVNAKGNVTVEFVRVRGC